MLKGIRIVTIDDFIYHINPAGIPAGEEITYKQAASSGARIKEVIKINIDNRKDGKVENA